MTAVDTIDDWFAIEMRDDDNGFGFLSRGIGFAREFLCPLEFVGLCVENWEL